MMDLCSKFSDTLSTHKTPANLSIQLMHSHNDAKFHVLDIRSGRKWGS